MSIFNTYPWEELSLFSGKMFFERMCKMFVFNVMRRWKLTGPLNRVYWCDPCERRYLLKTLLVCLWRLIICMKIMLEPEVVTRCWANFGSNRATLAICKLENLQWRCICPEGEIASNWSGIFVCSVEWWLEQQVNRPVQEVVGNLTRNKHFSLQLWYIVPRDFIQLKSCEITFMLQMLMVVQLCS